jgi:thiol-disulfide isomerase/thioredoxin
MEGKSVLVVFWAPWSAQCKKTISEMNQLQKKFADRLVVVGITSEREAQVQEMTDPKVEFASAIDTKAKLSTAAGLTSIPSVLLVDQAGIVRYQGHPAALTETWLQGWLAKSATP